MIDRSAGQSWFFQCKNMQKSWRKVKGEEGASKNNEVLTLPV
jgi:hypothetical protein